MIAEPINLAAIRAYYGTKRGDIHLAPKPVRKAALALCTEIERLRAENANHEKLVRDAYSFAERMLPVVEAARAWLALSSVPGADRLSAFHVLKAAVAAYEAAQPNMGDALLNVSLEPKVVQPSSPVEGRTAEGREDVGEQSAAGDQRHVTWGTEMGGAPVKAGDQRGCDHKCLDMFGKCIHCAWMNSFAIVAERDATIARLRAALLAAADMFDAITTSKRIEWMEATAYEGRDAARAAAGQEDV